MQHEDIDHTLIHYGVLGMKWGVRKQKTSSSSGKSSSHKKQALVSKGKDSLKKMISKRRDAKKAKKENKSKKSVKPKDMSDAELKQAISRLQLEKQYKDLKKSQVGDGNKLVMEILRSSSRNIGEQLVTYEMGKLVNAILKEQAVNPKRGQKK